MRIRLILLFPMLVAICLAPTFAQRAGGTVTKTLFIMSLPTRDDDPVRIRVMEGATELKSDGRSFPSDYAWETAFDVGDDWITNLSFVIKNVSPKKITCIQINFPVFEAPFWQNESLPRLPMLGFTENQVGQRPEHALHVIGGTLPPDTYASFELAQGEEFTMPIEDPKDYPALKAHIEKKLPISNATAMMGGIVAVFFDDGTRWFSVSHTYGRPAPDPESWTRISYEEWAGQPKSSEQ
jgi:hypothetical protein